MVSIRPAIAFGLLGVAGLAGAAAVAQVGAGRRPAARGGAADTGLRGDRLGFLFL